LIVELLKKFPDDYLPTYGEVLCFYYFHVKKTAGQNSKLCNEIAEKLIDLWAKAGFSTKVKRSVVVLIHSLVQRYVSLLKNQSSLTNKAIEARTIFSEELKSIFDLTCNGLDGLADKEKPKKNQKHQLDDKKSDRQMEVVDDLESESGDDGGDEGDSEYEDGSAEKYLKLNSGIRKASKKLQAVIKSADTTSVMDRLNMSDREGVLMIGAVAAAMGENIATQTLSRSSLRRYRQKNRVEITENIKNNTNWGDDRVVIHWDGKKLANATNVLDPKSKIERLGVVATGKLNQLLNTCISLIYFYFSEVLLVRNY
jgi:hypothetical protein